MAKLESIAACLKGDSVARIELGGHADDVGSTEYNLSLGESRAISVKNYLSRLGVDEGLMRTETYGESQPAVTGTGRQPKNRRVEFN